MAMYQHCEYCKKLIGKKSHLTITLDDETALYMLEDCLFNPKIISLTDGKYNSRSFYR